MQTADLFSQARIQGIYNALVDIRTLPQQMLFSDRVKEVPVSEQDLITRYVQYAQIADFIADNAEALTYSMGKFTLETNTNYNMKLGMGLTQEEINQLAMLMDMPSLEGEAGDVWKSYETRNMMALRLGIAMRKEWLLTAMLCDGDLGQGASALYSRFGFQIKSASWGMPSDLKVTTGTGWDTSASATPVADILSIKLLARRRYGIVYDRMTMSTAAFQYMIATTEFQTKAKLYIPPTLQFGNLTVQSIEDQLVLATNVLQLKQIILYDGTYTQKAADGTTTVIPFLPVTKVILDVVGNDNNTTVQDFGDAVVTESRVAQMVGGPAPSIPAKARGPVVYATLSNAQLNPPGVTYWAVKRGYPRKHLLQSNACLTVGTFADTISLTAAF